MNAKIAGAALALLLPLSAGCIIQVKGSGSWEGGTGGWKSLDADDDLPRRIGSGVPATETRAVEPFEELRIVGDLTVVAVAGEEHAVSVTGDDNLLDHVELRRRGRRLTVELEPARYTFDEGVEVRVGAPVIAACWVEGRGSVTLEGLSGERFVLVVDDTAAVQASGAVDAVEVEVNGTSSIDLFDLDARTAEVEINGTGSVMVTVSEALDTCINGTGTVLYRGHPVSTSAEINGAGHVRADRRR